MTVHLRVVPFPSSNTQDVPASLRALADSIEAGSYGDAHNVAYVIDCGDKKLNVGLLGKANEPGAEVHLLFALGQRLIENGAM